MSSPTIFLAVELKQILYTYKDAAKLLAVSESFVKQLAQVGQLKRIYLTPGVDRPHQQPRIVSQSIVDYVNGKIAEAEPTVAPA